MSVVFAKQQQWTVSWFLAAFGDQFLSQISPHLLEMAEVEETLKRIQGQKGVQGIIIVNSEGKNTSFNPYTKINPFLYLPSGIPIKTTLDNSSTVQYAGLIHQLVMKARSTVRDMDPQNDLTFLRVRSKKNEIMIAP
ncbi:hypothetical protein INR49_002404, partial [Caranx melampygus]